MVSRIVGVPNLVPLGTEVSWVQPTGSLLQLMFVEHLLSARHSLGSGAPMERYASVQRPARREPARRLCVGSGSRPEGSQRPRAHQRQFIRLREARGDGVVGPPQGWGAHGSTPAPPLSTGGTGGGRATRA